MNVSLWLMGFWRLRTRFYRTKGQAWTCFIHLYFSEISPNIYCRDYGSLGCRKKRSCSMNTSITKLQTHEPSLYVCVIACLLVCVPQMTLNLLFLILGRKWASAALGCKTAFGRSPRAQRQERGQRISVSSRCGTGCEEIAGNVNNRSNRGRAAACSQCNTTTRISIWKKLKQNISK